MSDDPQTRKPSKLLQPQDRAVARAESLRANLLRRKTQTRGRAELEGPGPEAEKPPVRQGSA